MIIHLSGGGTTALLGTTKFLSHSKLVCVCVCVRERERARARACGERALEADVKMSETVSNGYRLAGRLTDYTHNYLRWSGSWRWESLCVWPSTASENKLSGTLEHCVTSASFDYGHSGVCETSPNLIQIIILLDSRYSIRIAHLRRGLMNVLRTSYFIPLFLH
jgi:hypothetical protein